MLTQNKPRLNAAFTIISRHQVRSGDDEESGPILGFDPMGYLALCRREKLYASTPAYDNGLSTKNSSWSHTQNTY
jgi:hypothetical protein